MRCRWIVVPVLGVLLLFAGSMAFAQSAGAAAKAAGARVTGVITDATGGILPGVTVTIKGASGSTDSTVTDGTGRYTFDNVAPGAYEITAELSGFTKQVMKVTVTADQAATADVKMPVAAQAETVQVTGTLIPRPTLEAMSPVTTLEVEELTYRGINRVEDLLMALPQVFAAQNSTASNNASGTATVDLRYLGPQRTLVLLDGRRMMPGDASPGGGSAAISPDLNFIPSALVKRVDVLTGGASSVYGADAVAGVVNFVLDRDFQGIRGGFQQSGYQHNNNNTDAQAMNRAVGFTYPSGSMWNAAPTDFNIALGSKFGDRQGHAAMYIDYRTTPAITKDARDYTNCSVEGGLTMDGTVCAGSSTWPYGRFITSYAPGTPNAGRTRNYVVDPNGSNGDMRLRNGATDLYNYAPSNYMQRPDKRWAAGGFLNYVFNPKVTGYADVMLMYDVTDAQIAPSGDFTSTDLINCDNPMMTAQQRDLLCTQMGWGPHDLATILVGRRNVEGGGRNNHLQHNSMRFSFGLKGDLNKEWNYDVYSMQGTMNQPTTYQNDFNKNRIQNALIVDGDPNDPSTWHCRSTVGASPTDFDSLNCVPWNIFRKTTGRVVANVRDGVTQAALDYLQLPEVLDAGTRTRVISGKIAGDLKKYGVALPTAAEGIKVAGGMEYRQERLFVTPDLAYQLGLGAGSGGPVRGVDGIYDVYELFSEGLIPLVQEARGAKDLSLELGYRMSDYSNAGRWPTYKVQASWAPALDVKMRVGYNRATRAPNVNELYVPQAVSLFGTGDICAGSEPTATQAQCALMGVPANMYGYVLDNPAGQYNTFTGGNPNLVPETANTYTAGLVLSPRTFPGFTAALDFYNIRINNTIGALNADQVQSACAATGDPALCSLIHRDPYYTLWLQQTGYTETLNSNVGMLQSQGLDINGTYTRSLGSHGLFSVNIIGTYLLKSVTDTGLYTYDCVGYFGNVCGVPSPKWRHLTRFSWETPFKATFFAGWRMIGSVLNEEASPNPAIGVPANAELNRINGVDKFNAHHYLDLGATYKLGKNYTFIAGVNNVFDKEPPLAPGSSPNDYGTGFYGTYDPLGRYFHWSLQFTF